MHLTIAPLPADGKATDDALALLRAGLGTGYLDEPEVRAYQQGKGGGLVLGAHVRDELAGVLLARLLTPEEATRYAALVQQAGSSVDRAFHKAGILQSIVVQDSYRGQGIGTALCQEAITQLRRAGTTALLALSWESGAVSNSRGMLERLGLKVVARIKEFWLGDSLAKGYRCPRCGHPCRCAALLHVQTL